MLLRDKIYQSIRHAILTCDYRPGEELREQTLAARYRVSRSPVRDSLLRLEREDLVTVLPRQGYRVRPISMSDVQHLYGLRLLIEPACAAAAAQAGDVTLHGLNRFRRLPGNDNAGNGGYEENPLFHRAVAELCGNPRLAAVATDLAEQFARLRHISLTDISARHRERVLHEHVAIIDAIQAHDPENASRLAYEHAVAVQQRLSPALLLVVDADASEAGETKQGSDREGASDAKPAGTHAAELEEG